MFRFPAGLAISALVAICSSSAAAQTSVVTQIGYVFPSISRMSLGGNQSLVLNRAGRGVRDTASVASTYAITTNASNGKIVAQLDADMPPGITLSANLGAPAGGTSTGAVVLTAVPAALVTGITAISESDLPIAYVASAGGARSVRPAKRTVVFTIIAGM